MTAQRTPPFDLLRRWKCIRAAVLLSLWLFTIVRKASNVFHKKSNRFLLCFFFFSFFSPFVQPYIRICVTFTLCILFQLDFVEQNKYEVSREKLKRNVSLWYWNCKEFWLFFYIHRGEAPVFHDKYYTECALSMSYFSTSALQFMFRLGFFFFRKNSSAAQCVIFG